MIEVITKDITTVTTGVVAHGVNCQLKMASGVAKAVRKKWPEVYEKYMSSPRGRQMLGVAHIININPAFDDMFVANCYTQDYYGYGGKKYASPEAVEKSLLTVFKHAKERNLDIYLPKIGCGLGGLSWEGEVLQIVTDIDSIYNKNNATYICEWD